jgi:hypothetical protein
VQAAKTGSRTTPEPIVGLKRKRKRILDTSRLSDGSGDDLARSLDETIEPEDTGDTTQPTRSERARLPAKRGRPQLGHSHRATVNSKSIEPSSARSKGARPPPVFKPASSKPLPGPEWTAPPSEPAKTFKLPTSSFTPNPARTQTTNKQQKLPAKAESSKTNDSTSTEPSYAEIEPFEFKLVVSYSDDGGMEYYHSTDLANNMVSFWSRLRKLREEWEDTAGAEWAYELQKMKRKRYCVSRRLAKLPTRWRKGDKGSYACTHCEKNASLCFTWVEDDNAELDDGEAGDSDPKGEFWCLPVHTEDHKGEKVKEDREVRTWLNGDLASDTDSSGEELGESSEEDEFKVGSDYDQISQSESSSEEEDNAEESDEDDEL